MNKKAMGGSVPGDEGEEDYVQARRPGRHPEEAGTCCIIVECGS